MNTRRTRRQRQDWDEHTHWLDGELVRWRERDVEIFWMWTVNRALKKANYLSSTVYSLESSLHLQKAMSEPSILKIRSDRNCKRKKGMALVICNDPQETRNAQTRRSTQSTINYNHRADSDCAWQLRCYISIVKS